jgi:hypothetical protein
MRKLLPSELWDGGWIGKPTMMATFAELLAAMESRSLVA